MEKHFSLLSSYTSGFTQIILFSFQEFFRSKRHLSSSWLELGCTLWLRKLARINEPHWDQPWPHWQVPNNWHGDNKYIPLGTLLSLFSTSVFSAVTEVWRHFILFKLLAEPFIPGIAHSILLCTITSKQWSHQRVFSICCLIEGI